MTSGIKKSQRDSYKTARKRKAFGSDSFSYNVDGGWISKVHTRSVIHTRVKSGVD
jgi:hypothetical protein